MNTRRLLAVALALLLSPAAAFAGMDLATLRANPMWMPAETSVKKPLEFQSGLKLSPKDKLTVVSLEDDGALTVSLRGKEFSFAASNTNLLADADAYRATFTPEQQKMTQKELLARADLRPYWVTMTRDVRFVNGPAFLKGAKVAIADVDGDDVNLVDLKSNKSYATEASATDYCKRALAAMIKPVRPPLLEEIYTYAVRGDTMKPDPNAATASPKYIALYNAADWCPFCKQCTPEVVKWYDETVAGKRSSVELVMVSGDKSMQEWRGHLKRFGMKWLAIPQDQNQDAFLIVKIFPARPTPFLYIIDANGKTVYEPKDQTSALARTQEVLAKLRELQAQEAAAGAN